jgi:hypothetical protein
MEIKERSSLVIQDKLNFVSNCYNIIRPKHKNIVKKSRDLFLQIKYIITGICDTPCTNKIHNNWHL